MSAEEIPFLTGAPDGRRFLAAGLPRALARGEPAAYCPATAVASGTADPETAAVEALAACLDQVATLAPGLGCGCRVVALNRALTIPRDETAYATGITARLVSDALGLDLLVVAEETDEGTILRDLGGRIADLEDGERAVLRFTDGTGAFEGPRIPVGFRRGRLGARYYLTDEAGRRLTLLIGFDPDELAAGAGAWLAWGG